MELDQARRRMAELMRSAGHAFIDSQAERVTRQDSVALRNELESLMALFADERFDAVAEFESRSVSGRPGVLRVTEGGGR